MYSFGFINHANLVIQIPVGSVKDAATGAEVNLVRLVTSSKLPLWKKMEAYNCMDFPGLEADLRQNFITFSVGKDHLEALLNSFKGYFSSHMTWTLKVDL